MCHSSEVIKLVRVSDHKKVINFLYEVGGSAIP